MSSSGDNREGCNCPVCLDNSAGHVAAAQPARSLADQAHPPIWPGLPPAPAGWALPADEAEAGLLGEPPGVSPAEAALPSGSVAGEARGVLAALGDRPAFLTPAEATLELSRLRREVRELRGRRAGVAGPARPARTHEWKFEGGSVVVTVETGGDFTYPDGCVTTDSRWVYQSFHVLGAEILRLAGRAQAAEAALAEAEASWRGEAGVLKRSYAKFVEQELRVRRRLADAETALATAEGRADMAEERAADRDALLADHEQGLEINAELTAALAALLGEPPPEPCSPGCRTPHLSAKAGKAVDEALGRWQELEGMVRECVPGNWVIRQLRELREALKARGLWRPAGQGDPGGGTAGSAIEAIDRLRVRNAILDDLADDACEIIAHLRAGYERDAKRWGSDTIQARIRAVVDDASGLKAERLLEAEKEKASAPLRAEIDRLTAELAEARASARHNAEGWEAERRRMGKRSADPLALATAHEDGRKQGKDEAAAYFRLELGKWQAAGQEAAEKAREEGRQEGLKWADAEALEYAGEVVRHDWIPISPYYICRTIADRIKALRVKSFKGQPGEVDD